MAMISSQPISMRNYQTVNRSAFPMEPAKRIDLDSFNNLVLEHQNAVYRQAFWILREEAAAEDATQEAFIRAYKNLNLYNGGPFLPWILRITTNYCLDQLRRQKVRKTTSLEVLDENDEEIENPTWLKDPSSSVEETLIRAEEQAWVMSCIHRLPVDYKTAIILVDLQDLDYAEAAASMGICLGTFKSRLARAREQLQKQLKAKGRAC